VNRLRRATLLWSAIGIVAYCLLPWYAVPDGLFALGWLTDPLGAPESASAALNVAVFSRLWLLPPGIALLGCLIAAAIISERTRLASILVAIAGVGLALALAQGFAIGLDGWSFRALATLFGVLEDRQFGVGLGGGLVATSLLFLLTAGLAGRGLLRGDPFTAGVVGALVALVGLFTIFPLSRILLSALLGGDGGISVEAFLDRLLTDKIWGFGCLTGRRCGVAWNTLLLALMTAAGTTVLGLAFALVATRTNVRAKPLLRLLTVLPIITPPFVIGLGLILLFGRAGLANQFLAWAFDISPSRWIYGLQGVWLAQMFAFTPIAFLVLIGVVQGVNPSMEEAAQTLRAGRWQTFAHVSLPLMRPGLANAFLVGFVESIADFGNPIVLGGDYGVLSTEIFFSIVGAQFDQGRAATLAVILLLFALGAFFVQRAVLGRKSYVALTGKGAAGHHPALPHLVRRACFAVVLPWTALTIVIYAMALVGGFVETWGRNYTPTLRHYAKAFSIEWSNHGLIWTGAAWNSFWTTVELAVIAAPLTAALGILTAYVLVRQRFAGRGLLEFATMLSFAVPGTVIGVSYVLAFNVPPLELTGTGIILVLCFIFRNMPVGVRSGIAAMSQIDRSLDEAALMLKAGGATTLRRVILPLLRPAIVSALIYSFVRAMTTVSAVVFLVSAEYEMATTYIINRVVNGDYGVAIAYSTVLILLMLLAILLIQFAVGERRRGRIPVPASPSTPLTPRAA
jgi:iron(III) transport system permease protein